MLIMMLREKSGCFDFCLFKIFLRICACVRVCHLFAWQVCTQTGRIFSLALDGEYTRFAKWISLWYFVTFLFGGSFVPISNAPPGVRWLFYISPTFWAITGGTMAVIQQQAVLPTCDDLFTCTVMDAEFLTYYLGLAPYSNSTLAWWILLVMYVVQLAAEALLLVARTRRSEAFCPAIPSGLTLSLTSEVQEVEV